MRFLARLAAAFSVVSILACSGLGLCWESVAAHRHDCCQREDAKTPPKPCASAGADVQPVKVAPAVLLVLPVGMTLLPQQPTMSQPASAFAPAFPMKAPPLVLRI
jgi:hypothetical protein